MDVIKTTGLTKAYGRKRVVDGLSITVRRGDIYGFVGRNGAGKSTVMKMIAGLLLPTEGEVYLFGERQVPGTASRRMGAVIEDPGILRGLTGLDNVMYRALALGIPNPYAASRAALAEVGLEAVAKKRAKTYSLGMKQRLGLALALVGSPDVLMLDEPFNGLDPQGVREIRSLIVRLAQERGVTVFISSHVLDQLERMVTRYGVIREGRLVREMSAEEVERACADHLLVRCPAPQMALTVLQDAYGQAACTMMEDDAIIVTGGAAAEDVGRLLAAHSLAVSELSVRKRDIEEYFVALMGHEAPADAEGARKRGESRA